MRRSATVIAVALAIGSATVLYWVSYETKLLEARAHVLERRHERLEAEIAAARAELAYLSRPERIEPLARALGLAPPTAQQLIAEDRLPRRPKVQP